MSTTIFESFSLTRASVLDGTTGIEDLTGANFYGCRNGSLTPNTGSFDNTGDDFVLSHWVWFDYATVTVEDGYIDYNTLALLQGSPIHSSGSAPNDYYTVPLWTRGSLNQPTYPMVIRTASKDSNHVVRTMDFLLYAVQFNPVSFTGPTYKTGLTVSYTGTALISPSDEVGNTLTEPAIGRLINYPGQLEGAIGHEYGVGLSN